jgi:hypothetical protein
MLGPWLLTVVLVAASATALPLPYYGYPHGLFDYGYFGGYYGYPYVHPGYYFRRPYAPPVPSYTPSKLVYHGQLKGKESLHPFQFLIWALVL